MDKNKVNGTELNNVQEANTNTLDCTKTAKGKSVVMREITELRTNNRRAFEMEDGSKELVFYPETMEEYDEDTLATNDADNPIVFEKDGKHFKNVGRRFTARFSDEDASDELFSIEDGIYSVTVFKNETNKTVRAHKRPQLIHANQADASFDKFLFSDVEDNVDYEYTTTKTGIKENIIIKEKALSYCYSFILECKNVIAEHDDTNNNIIFRKVDDNGVAFEIPAPFMIDASGMVSNEVWYSLQPIDSNKIELTVIAEKEWINAENRAFPVTIDPRISVSGSTNFETYSYTNGSINVGRLPTVGIALDSGELYTNRMYIALGSLNIPRNVRIKQATLTLYQFAAEITQTTNLPKIGVFDALDSNLAYGGNMIDYAVVQPTANSTSVVSYNFDITHFIEEANLNLISIPTLIVKCLDEDYTNNNYVAIYGSSYSKNKPTINITYETNYEVNSTSAVHTHEIGRFGTGMIDLRNGYLMFESEDFAWAGNKMPVTIKHLYTSALAGYQYTANSTIKLDAADFSAMNVGNGWHLNIMQSIASTEVTYEGTEYTGFVFMDEAGNKTYFIPEDDSDITYKDIDNNGMTYNKSNNTLTNGNEVYTFDDEGRLISISTSADGSTTAVSMAITYTNGKITCVTDGAGREFVFNYEDDTINLASITAPDGTAITYSYINGNLSTIGYPNNTTTVISTSSNKIRMVDIYNNGNDNDPIYRVYYEYSRTRVSDVEERGTIFVDNIAQNEFGACSHYDYYLASNRTVVTTTEAADTASGETADNVITTVYSFDHDGNILSRSVSTNEISNVGIDGEAGGINPHSADGGIDLASNVVNLLPTRDWAQWSDITTTATNYTFTVATDENYTDFGKTYLNMESNDTSGTEVGKCYTFGPLSAGDYAFSVYVNTDANGITGAQNSGAFLRVRDASGNILTESERMNRGEWNTVRLVAPFTLSSEQNVTLEIVMNGAGKIRVAAPQIERGQYANAYDFIENGNFNRYFEKWQTSGAEMLQFPGEDTITYLPAIEGDVDAYKCFFQAVSEVKSKKSHRETFTLSGWAYGRTAVMRDRDGISNDQTFRLKGVIVYKNGETEEHYADFCPCTEGWQFTSVQFAKTKFLEVEFVAVFAELSYTSGMVYFNNISLTRDSWETGLEESDFAIDNDVSYDDYDSEEAAIDKTPKFEEFTELYDAYGNPLTETTFTDGEFGTMYRSFEYSEGTADNPALAGNDLVTEYDARNNKTEYQVDPVTSRVTKVTGRMGNITTYEYDAAGRTTKVANKTATETQLCAVEYTYDEFDNLSTIERNDGMDYALTYNAFHKLESIGITGKAEPLTTYTYKEGNGRLKEITYANGDYMKATYNSLGQLVTEKWYNSSNTLTAHYKYAYDHDGNIVRSIDILANVEYNYIYENGRIVRATQCTITMSGENVISKNLDFAIHYVYDKDGKLVKKYTSDDAITGGTFYAYDNNDGTVVQYMEDGKAVTSHSKTDHFGRKEFDEIQLSTGCISRRFTYLDGEAHDAHVDNNKHKSTPTTNLVSEITLSDGHVLSYEYDAEERITKYTDTDTLTGTSTVTEYTYDALGQLTRETRDGVGMYGMLYDNRGNIYDKGGKVCAYNSVWKDQLEYFGSQTISYDAQGNPITYLGHTLTWEKGRQLKSFDTNTYTYNANGIRTSKTIGGVKHTYRLDGTKILREAWGENILTTLWDNEDNICGIRYNDASYYFLKNLQGDVIAITDNNGDVVARYSYDAWGACTITSDTSTVGIATINPFRYRSYYYDAEIGMYYLQSRYYDPATARFINADSVDLLGISKKCILTNLFTYCLNDPVNKEDTTGYAGFEDLWSVIADAFSLISSIAEEALSACQKTKTMQEIKKLSKQSGKSQRQIIRELNALAIDSKRSLKHFKIAGIVISVISVIIFAVSYIQSGLNLFAGIYALIVDLFIEALSWFICTISERLLNLIPVGGIIIGFAVSWVIGMIIASFFTSSRKNRMSKAYEVRMKNSTNWYDWFINLFVSVSAIF